MPSVSMIDGHVEKSNRTDAQKALDLLNNFRESIFATKISDKDADLLLETIFEWKAKARKYDELVYKNKQK